MSNPSPGVGENEADMWERFENVLRWHFNVVADEGKDSAYIALGVTNARLQAERIIEARLAALTPEAPR